MKAVIPLFYYEDAIVTKPACSLGLVHTPEDDSLLLGREFADFAYTRLPGLFLDGFLARYKELRDDREISSDKNER